MFAKEKNLGQKLQGESAKRDIDIFKMAESTADDSKAKDGDKGRPRKTLKQARALLESSKSWTKRTQKHLKPSKDWIRCSKSTCKFREFGKQSNISVIRSRRTKKKICLRNSGKNASIGVERNEKKNNQSLGRERWRRKTSLFVSNLDCWRGATKQWKNKI